MSQDEETELELLSPKKERQQDLREQGVKIVKAHQGTVWLRYWVHLAALLTTAALSALNFKSLYYTDSNDRYIVAKLGAFQFVAKVHELLLGASLTLILLDRVRTGLMSDDGVALGQLLSPDQLQSFGYLMSAQFWKSLRLSSQFHRVTALPIGLLLFFAAPFSLVAGPLSAIIVVPRQGWSNPRPAPLAPVFVNVSAAEYWPDTFLPEKLLPNCFDTRAESTGGCPIAAAKTVYLTYSSNSVICDNNGFVSTCNVSLDTVGGDKQRQLSLVTTQGTFSSIASTLVDNDFGVFANLVSERLGDVIDVPGADVIDSSLEQMIFPRVGGGRGFYKPVVKTDCRYMSSSETQGLTDVDWRHYNLTFGHSTDAFGEPVVTVLGTYHLDSTATGCTGNDCHAAILCEVTPQWAPVHLWYDTQQPNSIYQDHPSPTDFNTTGAVAGTRRIHFPLDWLRLFQIPSYDANGVPYLDLYTSELLSSWKSKAVPSKPDKPQAANGVQVLNPTTYAQGISVALSLVFTEAIADSQGTQGFSYPEEYYYTLPCNATFFTQQVCDRPPSYWATATSLGELDSTMMLINFQIQRFGYGWFMDSVTITIALAVLLLHALLLLVYLGALVTKKTILTAYDSSTEMLVLALESIRSNRLLNSSAGVVDNEVWRERVTIREIIGTSQLSLVVGSQADYKDPFGPPPLKGKKYV